MDQLESRPDKSTTGSKFRSEILKLSQMYMRADESTGQFKDILTRSWCQVREGVGESRATPVNH